MTDTDKPTPRDVRLAVALVKHYRTGTDEGMNEIIRETIATNRADHLLASLLEIHAAFVIATRTDAGIVYFGETIESFANPEATDDDGRDMQHAVSIITGHGNGDLDTVNNTLRTVDAQDRGTHLIQKILDAFDAAIPELSTRAGIAWLDACITTGLQAEGGDK